MDAKIGQIISSCYPAVHASFHPGIGNLSPDVTLMGRGLLEEDVQPSHFGTPYPNQPCVVLAVCGTLEKRVM
ncbi:hypothetical protein TREES_T100014089 [Tupaia chinensis]|uniref:Uncharacterized protein n=1 Tax=Tupaia chinensis TaxID=246437 RepID=L9KQ26_TUPCH|nr:hypothetical protein TREES_T100014089 [Tupaia chinensis]